MNNQKTNFPITEFINFNYEELDFHFEFFELQKHYENLYKQIFLLDILKCLSTIKQNNPKESRLYILLEDNFIVIDSKKHPLLKDSNDYFLTTNNYVSSNHINKFYTSIFNSKRKYITEEQLINLIEEVYKDKSSFIIKDYLNSFLKPIKTKQNIKI